MHNGTQCNVEKLEILSHLKQFSSNQLFSNLLFCKTVNFTKFLPKMREREFPKFPHCVGADAVFISVIFNVC